MYLAILLPQCCTTTDNTLSDVDKFESFIFTFLTHTYRPSLAHFTAQHYWLPLARIRRTTPSVVITTPHTVLSKRATTDGKSDDIFAAWRPTTSPGQRRSFPLKKHPLPLS